MVSIEERLARLERQPNSTARILVQYVLAPVLLLCLGFQFNRLIERQRAEVQASDSNLKRMEEVRQAAAGLFGDTPEKVHVSELLLEKLLGPKEAAEFSELARSSGERVAQERAMHSVDSFAKDLKREHGEISKAVDGALGQRILYVVVGSFFSPEAAKRRVAEIATAPPGLSIHQAANGMFALVLGGFPRDIAKQRLEEVRNSFAHDAYLSDGAGFDQATAH